MSRYSKSFYAATSAGGLDGANHLVGMVLDLVPAKRVIDLGCGTGGWLSAFSSLGVETIVGVDGDWVPRRCSRFRKSASSRTI